MTCHFFAIPAVDSAAEQVHLNGFCQRHRVVSIDRQFVNAGTDPHWAMCVQVAWAAKPTDPIPRRVSGRPALIRPNCKAPRVLAGAGVGALGRTLPGTPPFAVAWPIAGLA